MAESNHQYILASLLGIEASLKNDSGTAPPDLLCIPLSTFGEAIQAGMEKPPRVISWVTKLPKESIEGALAVNNGDRINAFVKLAAMYWAVANKVAPVRIKGLADN